MSVRVVAPCRLHFGLFHVPVDGLTHYPDGRPVRKFGGLGLMIDQPCVTVTAMPAEVDSVRGSLGERVTAFIRLLRVRDHSPPLSLIADGPQEHVGFGVGTALGMCVGWAYHSRFPQLEFTHLNPLRTSQIAESVGRGDRSAIGVYGFELGGFIVDGGKEPHERLSRLESRIEFPADWRIVLVRPPVDANWHGDVERGAFARHRLAERALRTTRQLHIIARSQLIPALQDADFDTFAHSIHEFNRLAGEPFHDDQGGPYASPEVACVINELQEMGAVGVGQSSWGPTVFAFARDADEAEHLAKRARDRFSSATEVTVTAANNTGAKLESTNGSDQPHQ